ncbi:hypothetical protein F9288_08400 [Sphingomonas sp. CL5.1]|uniref:hypothetical protein n=1 Tax=Sphingomonas sp. CL5.1 TaxID=2653203 RepID=UPI001582970E|nr:hypothetical protein [Sphingomonas sp. CL5.1]QKR99661.1 hypothetical protein F9288_08400 [Sphingomonas sp. CL5.1]
MWAIFPDGEIHRFGRQSFATMDEARDPECEAAITAADIIVNPSHDRMGNAGMLHAKRCLLSAPAGRKHPRIYVSCSNWNTDTANGAQSPSPTLHTVYVDVTPIEGEEYQDGTFGLVYRHWEVPPRSRAG